MFTECTLPSMFVFTISIALILSCLHACTSACKDRDSKALYYLGIKEAGRKAVVSS